MPDLAEQDGRRPLGAPAQRAGLLPPAITAVRKPRLAAPGEDLVITGPSGVGKGTLIRLLLERFPDMELSVRRRRAAAAGRGGRRRLPLPRRREEFQRRIEAGEFLEWAEYAGNRYGTLRSELERDVEVLVLEIEVQGARQVRERVPDAV